MKKSISISVAAACIIALSSCNNATTETKTGGTKFNPTERTSTMSDSEREAAIAAKRASLTIDIKTLMESRGVKLTVLPPAPDSADISENISKKFAAKMMQIVTANGIGGIGNVPGFAFTATLSQTGKEATGTVPQKMIVKYDATYEVINVSTGDVYATSNQSIMGVGSSFEEANQNISNEIKNTPEMQQMLKTASEKIIAWYNDNFETFKNQVESAAKQGDLALALALVESVPEQSTVAFEYASKKQNELLTKLQEQHAAEELIAMKSAITEAKGEFTPEVAAHFNMIPTSSPEFKQAQSLYSEYEKKVDAKLAEDKVEAKAEAERAHQKELAQIEADKVKAKWQAQATSKALERDLQNKRGFWKSLGSRLLDVTNTEYDE